jgi:hypothetical protein
MNILKCFRDGEVEVETTVLCPSRDTPLECNILNTSKICFLYSGSMLIPLSTMVNVPFFMVFWVDIWISGGFDPFNFMEHY